MDICVTGISRGLGLSLAKYLSLSGNSVHGTVRDRSMIAPLQSDLGENVTISTVDVRSDESVREWSAGMVPDVVILNASMKTEDMLVDGLDAEIARDMIDTNLMGALRCVDAFLPSFLTRGRGIFVLIASTTALRPAAASASYSASKAGIAMAFRALRMRYVKQGIRFKIVYLGPMATEMWEGKKGWLVASSEQVAKRVVRFIDERKDDLYYPVVSTWLLRLSRWVPDRVFAGVSGRMLK